MKLFITAALALFATAALADEPKIFTLSIQNHVFQPATLNIPAGEKVKLLVKNLDKTPEEFESTELNREKVIAGNSEATVFVGPLPSGEYTFFGEFNPKTAQGKIVVK
jgi:plastocyanin